MNKKVKYISTLATTGIMALTGLAGTVSAATSLGSYRDLVKGIDSDRVAPYVLQNNQDRLTIADIMKEYNIAKFNDSAVISNSTVVKTGDTFVADKESYEVIVYGDIASKDGKTVSDGKVNSADANLMLKLAVASDKSKLVDNVNLEAADIVNDGKINSADANLALKFAVGKGTIDVDLTPEVNDSNYTLVLGSEYANNKNISTVPVDIKIAKALSQDKDLILRVLNSKGETVGSDVTATIKANMVKISETVNLTGEDDGTYTIQLIDTVKGKEVVLNKITVVLNTVEPSAARISTERTAWNSAKMSLANKGESDIVKMYYTVLPATEGVPTWNEAKSEFTGETTKTAKATDSKVIDEIVSTELESGVEYKVHYILENSYGSISKTVKTANVLSDEIKESQVAVDATKIILPQLAKNETKFTWEAAKNATGYTVTVYKNGNIIAEDDTITNAEYDIASQLKGSGKYKIEIVAKGSNVKDSVPVMSKEIEVKELNTVTDIAFEIDQTGTSILSWKDSNSKENVAEYEVKIYEYDEAKKDYKVDAKDDATDGSKITTTKVTLNLDANKAYKAVVKAITKSEGKDLLSSKEAELEGFYKIAPTANVAEITENTITLDLSAITIKGKKVTNYEAKVYTVQTKNPEAARYTEQKGVTTKYEDGKLVISGLNPNTQYAYKLLANANGTKGESAYIEQDSGNNIITLKKAPAIEGKIVVKDEKEAKAGTVYYDEATKKLSVDGAETITLDTTYSEKFRDSVAVIDKLRAGDKITIKDDNVTLELTNVSTTAAINFGDTVKGKSIVIIGKVFRYQISIDEGEEAKELRLSGNNANYELSRANADKITLDAGVVVTGANTYTVLAGKTATVNGVKVTAQQDTEMASKINDAGEKELAVTVRKEVNNLTFENVIAGNVTEKEAKIIFVGKANLADKQLGDITIKTTGGKVTVTKQNVNVSGALNVEVNSGEVDISDPALTGKKTINVSKEEGKDNTIITVNTKMAAPFAIPAGTEIKEYSDKELDTLFTTATSAEKQLIKTYIDAFKLNGKSATIKNAVAKGETLITIEFAEPITETTISGLM